MTRRATLVQVLRGQNGYSISELAAMQAIKTVQGFLTRAASLHITNAQLADRLVAFKTNGGSGLANAIVAITKEWDTPAVSATQDACQRAVAEAKKALAQAQKALEAVS